MERTVKLEYNGYVATIILPEVPNGKWIWKTEFLYAFDAAECELLKDGYTRVYYQISDKFGSYNAVRLMHDFHKFVVKEFGLCEKAILFGFSRGGLYAFNYALFYPECVEKVYLDAPVLDMNTWPPKDSNDQKMMFEEYCLNEESFKNFRGNPVDNFAEYFSHKIPTLLVAGCADEVVPFEANAGKMIEFCKENEIDIVSYLKPECKHHPHSLEDVSPIIEFVK